jgi:TonB family protein
MDKFNSKMHRNLAFCTFLFLSQLLSAQKKESNAGLWLNDSTRFFQAEGRQWIITKKGDSLLWGNYDKCLPQIRFADKRYFFSVAKNGKAGLLDFQKNVVVPLEFDRVEYQGGYDNFVHVWQPDGRCGIWNLQGREVLAPRFYAVTKKERGFFKVQDFETKKAGIVDSLGNIRLPLEYEGCDVQMSPGNYFNASKGMGSALFDPSGKQLTEFAYLNFSCSPYSPELVFAQKTGRKYDVLDKNGTVLPIPAVDGFKFFTHGIQVQRDNSYAFWLPDGRRVTDFNYQEVDRFFSENKARQVEKELGIVAPLAVIGKAVRNGKQVFITNEGKEIPLVEAGSSTTPTAKQEPALTENKDSKTALTHVDKEPEFPGGQAAFNKFVADNLKYPTIASENGVEGTVVLNFVVEEDGRITNIEIRRDIGNGCGTEAMRLVRAMPKWVPGQHNGRPVRVMYTLPVLFKLNKKQK